MKKLCFFLLLLSTLLQAKTSISDAQNLFTKGNFEDAYILFEKLFYENVTSETVNYYLGRSAFETTRYDEAVAAFERVLIENPKHHLARLELARTYFVLELYEQSEYEFDIVMKSTDVPAQVKQTVKLYVNRIEELKQKHTWSGFYSFGVEDDNNINNGNNLLAIIGPKVQDIAATSQVHFSDTYKKRGRYTFEHTFGVYAKNYQNNPANNFIYSYLSSGPKIGSKAYDFYLPITLSALNYGNTPANNGYFFFPEQTAASMRMPSQKVFNAVSVKLEAKRKMPLMISKKQKVENIIHYAEQTSTIFNPTLFLSARSFQSHKLGTKATMKYEDNLFFADIFYQMDRKYAIGRVDVDQNQWSVLLNMTKKLHQQNAILNMGAEITHRQFLDLQVTFNMRNDSYNRYFVAPTFVLDKKSKLTMSVNYITNRSSVPVYAYNKRSLHVMYSYDFDHKQIESTYKRLTK